MSGTSLDGIKASLIATDGVDIYEVIESQNYPFPDGLRLKMRKLINECKYNDEKTAAFEETEEEFNLFSLNIIEEFKSSYGEKINLIGLEGPTICQDTEKNFILQLGNASKLAEDSGIRIVSRFHDADMLNNGQGAPITATYFNAMAQTLDKPVVFINIGGTSSLTWIGHYGEISAFDCGPGNALIDDWMIKHAGIQMDYNGKMAATGQVHNKIIAQMMKHRFFAMYPPKSLSRETFNAKAEHLEGLSIADGAATAAAFISEAIAYSIAFYLPELPVKAFVCGGGASNPTLVRFIRQRLKEMNIAVILEEDVSLKINDAQAIAFIAARRIYNLPITFPTTTGVALPLCGGEIYDRAEAQ